MTTEIKARTFQRVATAAEWTSVNPILGNGEIGVDVTNNQFRVGDGVKRWLQLPPVGVTVGQIEALVDQYLLENPPAGGGDGGGGGGNLGVSTQEIAPGIVRLTISSSTDGGTPTNPVAPTLTGDPVISTYAAGGSRVTFTVTATGTPLNYQWYVSSNFADWTAITGATSASYQTPALTTGQNETYYRCFVSNSLGSVTSTAARLRVSPTGAPVITTQPVSPAAVAVGADVTLTVAATGATSYAWETTTSGPDAPDSEWTDYYNQTNATLTITTSSLSPYGAYFYRARVTNASGSVRSDTVRVQVINGSDTYPRILPGLTRYIVAAPGSTRTLTVAASGSGTITYRWRTGQQTVYLPQTTPSLTLSNLTPAQSGITYVAEAVGAGGSTATSGGCTIIVPNPAGPTITEQPDSVTTFVGAGASVRVRAAGGTITYQWQSSADGSSGWANIAGATSATYADGTQTTYLRCIVTNSAGTLTTRVVRLAFEGD